METTYNQGQGKGDVTPGFTSYESVLFPPELQALINDDKEIKEITVRLSTVTGEYYARIEQIRKDNNLQYNSQTSQPYIKDSKGSKPYIKENTSGGLNQ